MCLDLDRGFAFGNRYGSTEQRENSVLIYFFFCANIPAHFIESNHDKLRHLFINLLSLSVRDEHAKYVCISHTWQNSLEFTQPESH